MPDQDSEDRPIERLETTQFEWRFRAADWFTMLVLFGVCFLATALILDAIRSLSA